MAITNHERVGKAMDLLKQGLGPFVEREFKSYYKDRAPAEATRYLGEDRILAKKAIAEWDAAALLKLMWEAWNDVFRRTLGPAERSLVNELRDLRNKWAHQQTFSGDDAYRALDSAGRLLTAISASPSLTKSKRRRWNSCAFASTSRSETKSGRALALPLRAPPQANLKPWREVVTPHKDVASGRYQQAEFAADLWQVHLGEGTDEYKKPVEFFRRTYLTESLKHLLTGAVRRISGQGGDPVVQLQTNFGGGKTHSMLALYHLFSGTAPSELVGIDAVLKDAGTNKLPTAKRVVLVGNKISPGNPVKKSDGTIVRTLWGELAWQLGGKKAFERVRADDEKATSPGDALRELFNEYGPCLILIDEWVAYARQLHDQSDLPAGGFETQFSFAQVLTESAKLAKNCLLVISLPASDTMGSPHTQADDVEVGGQRGREALDRLRNVVGRVESSWRPASAEEGFEIVRRRLFEPLADQALFKDRDVVARAFADLYRTQHAEFPPECHDADYEKRIKAAYPIHPEIFDRLYTDWSTLVKFQRTRGVLRLMAAVIHSLWEKGDKNPLILPANIPIDDPRVQFELTRYLSDNWVPIIEKDVDGPSSLPLRIDGEVPNLGKFAACRRVARTIYLGSAPTPAAANRGVEDRRVKLGCVMPGESPAVFGDALRRLAAAATYLYQDGPRYWYSTQPTVTKLADDRAEQLKRDPDKVVQELDKRLRADLRKMGDFNRIHPMPGTSADVPDDLDARLVVLGIDHAYSKEPDNAAETAAKAIFETRGTAPRLYRNTIVFLAADKTRLQDLDEAVRKFLAWESILDEKEKLDLSPHQVKQAETQKTAADGAVTARLPETYQWLLVPTQANPQAPLTWQTIRLSGTGRACGTRQQEAQERRIARCYFCFFPPAHGYGPRALMAREPRRDPAARRRLRSLPLFAAFAEHACLAQCHPRRACAADVGARCLRLCRNLRRVCGSLSWTSLRRADDDHSGRHWPARAARDRPTADRSGNRSPRPCWRGTGNRSLTYAWTAPPTAQPSGPVQPPKPKRYHGTVTLDPARVGRDAGRIADEVVTHLVGLVGSSVRVTLEIEAEIPAGVSDNVVRTVTENSRTLKFASNSGFETE